jgi:photosystem II stability/assembly factor-like uncharacterized protein
MKRIYIALIFSVITIAVMVIAKTSIADTEENKTPEKLPALARMSQSVSLRTQALNHSLISLADGQDLLTDYSGDERLIQSLQSHQAQPLSMASADFDEDGVADLIAGFQATDGKGILVLYRGNIDSIYANSPQAQERRANGTFTDAPFLSPALVFAVPEAGEFLGAGDFDGDGHWDVLSAKRQSRHLHMVSGDGRGGLGLAKTLDLQGQVTALVVGEINRRDGLDDLVVGINGAAGARALVFEGAQGALRSQPEEFALPAQASSMALGQLDEEPSLDVVIAAGRTLLKIRGRDRKLSLAKNLQAAVESPFIESRSFPFAIRSVAVGDFEGRQQSSVAMLSEQGELTLLSQTTEKNRGFKRWKSQSIMAARWSGASHMLAARLSSSSADDLLVVDAAERQLHFVVKPNSSAQAAEPQAKLERRVLSAEVSCEPVSAIAMNLNGDAMSDIVSLRKGSATLNIAPSAASSIITVNSSLDTDIRDNLLTLREAMRVANGELAFNDLTASEKAQISGTPAAPGMDEIRFNITSNVASAEPARTAEPKAAVSQPIVGFGKGFGLGGKSSSPVSGFSGLPSPVAAPVMQASSDLWINLGPFGGEILGLAVDPSNSNIIYAGTNGGGIYKTINGGGSWNTVNSGLNNLFFRTLVINQTNPNIIYTGTNGGVYKTTNGGDNWNAVNSGLTGSSTFSLAIDPTNPDTLYAGTGPGAFGFGVFKSTNGGASWNPVNAGLPTFGITCLAVDPTNSNIIYAGTSSGGVFKTPNGGASWNAINTGLTNLFINTLVIDPTNPNTLYLGNSATGVFKSTNGGASWSPVNSGLPSLAVNDLAIDPTNPNILYAGTSGGVAKTFSGGSSWSAVSSGLPSFQIVALAIDRTNPNILYAGTLGGGVFKTANGGVNWSAVNNGLSGFTAPTVVIDGTNPNIIYAGMSDQGIFKSTNGGISWNPANSGLVNLFIATLVMDPTNSNAIYAATLNGVYKTTNGGDSWNAVNNGLTNLITNILAMDPTNPNTLYVGTNSGFFKTTSGGDSWNAASSGLPGSAVVSIAVDPTNSNIVYVGTNGGGVFKSTNGGGSWNAVNNGLTNLQGFSLAIDPTNPNTLYAGTFIGLFKSTNGGTSWDLLNSTIIRRTNRALALDPTNPNIVYAGMLGGAFRSTNGGATWAAFGIGLTNVFVYDLVIDPSNPNKIYAGTGNSVFSITSSGCDYALSVPTANSFPITGGSGSVTVNTTAGCSWTATSNTSWITVTSGSSGTGTGSVGFSVGAYSGSNLRVGTITIAGQVFSIKQFGTGSDCSLTPIAFAQPVNGALTNNDCISPYTAKLTDRYSFTGTAGQQIAVQLSSSDFDSGLYLISPGGAILTIDDDGGGGANSRIPAASGFFTLSSSGTFIIEVTSFGFVSTGSYNLSLLQASGNNCKYVINPTTQSFAAGGGSSSFTVITSTSCNWSAVSNNPSFITVNSSANNSGIGSVNFTVAANNGSTPRTGTLTVAGQTFTVSQGVGCTYFINPGIQVVSAAGGNGSIAVSAPNGCNWAATSNASFINITAGAGGTGSGTVNFNVAANPASTQRSGTITVAGLVFTVVQGNNQSVKTIDLTATLPKITDSIIIDGSTQPGTVIEINASGIRGTDVLNIAAGNSTIRGLVINRFNAPNTNVSAILLSGGSGSVIEACLIGTNSAGTGAAEAPVGNADFSAGISIRGSSNNRIGGLTAAARNCIAGVDGNGIVISNGATNNRLQGNFIGTDVTGSASAGNQRVGVSIIEASNNTIGGSEPGAGNLLSGNLERGISVTDNASAITVQGNRIGTDATGAIKIANRIAGIFLTAKNGATVSNTTIGGTTAAARNIISGNDGYGLVVSEGVSGTQVQGNYIGVAASGTEALGNGYGVIVTQANAIAVGGASESARNIISGNELAGIGIGFLIDNKTGGTGSLVQSNFIGSDINGAALGNKQDGIFVEVNSSTHSLVDNRIAFNGANGIRIPNVTANQGTPGVRIRMESNVIYNNAQLGIDLGEAGVTENDQGDNDAGANLQQNFPLLSVASGAAAADSITPQALLPINISFNSTPNATFTMQFFFGSSCSGSGSQFSGAVPVRLEPSLTFTTDASGNFSRIYNINIPDNVSGGFVNATATSADGNTSELSSCLQIGSGGGGGSSALSITGTQRSGKHLVIIGTGFVDGSKLFVNDEARKIIERTTTSLTGKKVAKGLLPGAKIRVQNPDGSMSNEWTYQ